MTRARLRTLAQFLMKSAFRFVLCATMAARVQAQDSKQGTDESWTATTGSFISNFTPSRSIESHAKSGNRTIDKQRFEVLGVNGGYRSFSETETETVEVDASTNRILVRRYRWDENGRRILTEVLEDRETATGEIRSTVENYSLYAPGYFDNRLHLNQRITATLKKDSTGEINEQQIGQPSAGNPSDGPKVIAKTQYVVKYAATGTQKTKTVENRDANGNFKTVLVETQESTQAPYTQHATLLPMLARADGRQ